MTRSFAPAQRVGKRFVNRSGHTGRGLRDVWHWRQTRNPAPWPASVVPPPYVAPAGPPEDGSLRFTVVGHSTVLIEVAGLAILTDPMWSNTAGPTRWLGVKRVCPPAVPFDALPPVDAVLLSHSHYDHLDRSTLRALRRRNDPVILTGLGVGRHVPSRRLVELDWWEGRSLGAGSVAPGVRATFVPAEHGSARTPWDRDRTLWGGFVLETPAGVVFFAGDTGAGDHFALVRERWGKVALAFLPIGAFEPRWFMAPVHMDPGDAVAASRTLGAAVSVAVHFGTFPLADESYDEPIRALNAAVPPGCDFRIPVFGQAVTLPRQP